MAQQQQRLVYQYSRVSTEYQSVESQQEALDEMRKKCETTVIRLEETVSGRKMKGEKLQYLKDLIEAGRVSEVHVYHIDRLGRNVMEGCKFVELCQRNGVKIKSHCQPWDFDTPEGKLMFHQLMAMAEYFLGNLSRGTAAGLARAIARGTFKGGTRGKWISAKVAERVDRILTLHKRGNTRRDIAKLLEMDERTVARIINNKDNLPKQRERVWDA